jgi:hypothetical protein
MQYQVPQFIDTEDKIAGPFTMRQFIYLTATCGVVFFLYFMLQSWIWLILAVVILGIGFSFAFVKINGQKLSAIARAAFMFYWNPQLYLWQPENQQVPKTPEALAERQNAGFDLEGIVSGLALKKAWQYVQTGSKPEPAIAARDVKEQKLKYQVFRRPTGELRAAKRVDYSG